MSIEKDFLIISYNEGADNFSTNEAKMELTEVIEKIQTENPAIIFVCTQESKSAGNKHLQHVLGNILIDDYNYQLLTKVDASVSYGSIMKNKNVRTRVYYNKELVSNEIITKSKNNSFLHTKSLQFRNRNIINENESYKSNLSDLPNKFIIKKVGTCKSKSSGLGSALNLTLFKGSILIRIEIEKNGKLFKFIVVNSHLYYTPGQGGKNGLEKRYTEFNNLINEFKLNQYYDDGYNVFFCGDLNFRLFKKDIEKDIKKDNLNISQEMINLFEQNKINYFDETHVNELYNAIHIITRNGKTNNNYGLLSKFYENAKKFGIHLTCKIHEKTNNLTPKCYNKKNNKGMFNCTGLDNKYPRIPSMCDKILVANQNDIKFTTEDFKVLRELRISDHFMISLTGEFLDNSTQAPINKVVINNSMPSEIKNSNKVVISNSTKPPINNSNIYLRTSNIISNNNNNRNEL